MALKLFFSYSLRDFPLIRGKLCCYIFNSFHGKSKLNSSDYKFHSLCLLPASFRVSELSSSVFVSFVSDEPVSSSLDDVDDSWPFWLDSFFHFIRLFWNQVLTWVSFKPRVCASLARLEVSKYFCSANVFSRTRSWRSVKTVRDLRHLRPLGVRRVGLTRKYTGNWLKTSGLGSAKGINQSELLSEEWSARFWA